jgi:hypothetical protein
MFRTMLAAALLSAVAIVAFEGGADAKVPPYAVTCPIVIKVVHTHPTVKYWYRDCGAFVR